MPHLDHILGSSLCIVKDLSARRPSLPLAAFPSALQSAERLHRAVARPVCAEKGESHSVQWGHISAAQHRETKEGAGAGAGAGWSSSGILPRKVRGAAAAHSRRAVEH